MSEAKNFRITLDLSCFLKDHRRLAKIFISNNLKSVQDLQNRIHEIFGLTGFYLSTQNHFLPVCEDLRVLTNNDIVCAIPCNLPLEQSLLSQDSRAVKPLVKPLLGTITEESSDASFVKKNLKRHSYREATSGNDEHELPIKKMKRKKSKNELSPTVSEKIKKHKTHKEPRIVEQSVCSIESSKKCNEIKEKFKQKAAVYCNYDYLGRPIREDSVRLSRHVDIPSKVFSKYTKPQSNTEEYLAKKAINIVRIDIIKDGISASNTNNDTVPDPQRLPEGEDGRWKINDLESPPKNLVKTIINHLEKNISPTLEGDSSDNLNKSEKSKQSIIQVNASDYTKNSLDQENIETIGNKQGTKGELTIINNPSSIPELNCLGMQISSSPRENSKDTFNTSSANTNLKKRSNSFRAYSGVGSLLEKLKESDSVVSQDSENSTQFITKRKRIRHRKRSSRKTDSPDFNSSYEPPLLPLKVEACPKLHITFNEKEGTDQNLYIKLNGREASNIESKIDEVKDVIMSNEEPDDAVLENKYIFSEENIMKAPMMMDKLPKARDVIAFQFIKLSENYTPTVSNYVVGMVSAWKEETKTVQFKILCGEQELKTPSGKLSLNSEEEVEKTTSDLTILWEKLLLPKLLFR